MAKSLNFDTKISQHTADGIKIRGQKLSSLIRAKDFVSVFFFHLTGKKPSEAERQVLNAILIASLDHGVEPASGFIPRVVASTGHDVLTSMASTLLALGPKHGGAITGCMEVLQELNQMGSDKEAAAIELVKKYREQKKRIPGYGHPYYKDSDPRAEELFKIARQSSLSPEFSNLAQILEHAIEEELRKKLILNIDGAIAALLLTMGIDPLAGNGIFGLARVAGSIAHITEELKENPGVRRLGE